MAEGEVAGVGVDPVDKFHLDRLVALDDLVDGSPRPGPPLLGLTTDCFSFR